MSEIYIHIKKIFGTVGVTCLKSCEILESFKSQAIVTAR